MSDTTPIQTLSLDEAEFDKMCNDFGWLEVLKITATQSGIGNSYFKKKAELKEKYWQAKQQVVDIDEVELRKKASEAWEVENKYHPNGINPTAFEFGYKVGYKAALKNK